MTRYCVWWCGVLQAVYILYRVIWCWDSFTVWTGLGLAFLSFVNYACFGLVLSAAEMGTPYTNWQDLLFVNWFVMAGTTFANFFWWFYLVVPIYAGYQYGPYIYQFICKRAVCPTSCHVMSCHVMSCPLAPSCLPSILISVCVVLVQPPPMEEDEGAQSGKQKRPKMKTYGRR